MILILTKIYFSKNKKISKIESNKIENEIANELINTDIFSDYYEQANKKLKELTLEEKIGQLFLVRYPNSDQKEVLKKYKFGGYLLFERDFKGKTKTEVKEMINKLQEASDIPLLIAVDEEGGGVVRVSSNQNLAKSRFKSPMELYKLGGLEAIKEDTLEKSKLLSNLGINLNLAPVVDVSTNPNDYMYKRSLGKNTNLTSMYAETVIHESKKENVSYTLKHFPGYGNNIDTHQESSIDNRSYEDIVKNDLPPFHAGIKAGAEAVLVSHNIVTSIDKNSPASLSKKIHELLRDELSFTGVIITDDLDMGAVSKDEEATIKAILAENNIIITTDYQKSIESVKQAIQAGTIKEETIDKLVSNVIAWKYYKGLLK